MDFLGIRPPVNAPISSTVDARTNYNELAYNATDGQTSQVDFEQTRLMLKRCYDAGKEVYEEAVREGVDRIIEDMGQRIGEEADNAVPLGTFDSWVAFTDLKGWEHWAFYDAASTFTSDDSPEKIPREVLHYMCNRTIEWVIETFENEAEWFND